jgi:hypothetical protein
LFAVCRPSADGVQWFCGVCFVIQKAKKNGQEALAAVETRAGGDAFDVLLIDLHTPLMGGMEVRKKAFIERFVCRLLSISRWCAMVLRSALMVESQISIKRRWQRWRW